MEPAPNAQPDPASLGELLAADKLLDTLPWAVLVVDEQGVVRRVNQQAAHWCGVPPGALLGQPLAQAPLAPAVRDTLLQLLEPGEVVPREAWLPQHARWVTLSATRQPGGWVLYGQDITPQKQREQQYQTLAANTPDVLTRWGPDLRLRYANAAFATKVGQPLSVLLGRSFDQMRTPADIAGPYLAALQRVFDTGQPQEHYNPFPTPHGTATYYSRLVPELRDGRVETVLGIARDVTALKQAETETLRLRDELTQRATDKYHALFYTMDQGFCVVEVLFDEGGQQAVDFRYLELNPVFAQQSGMPADAQGKTARELLPDLDPFWFDTYGGVALTGEPRRVERSVPQLARWFDVHAFRVGAPEARQVAVLFNDITARKHTEEQLRYAAGADTFRLQLADSLGPLTDPVAIQEAVTRLARLHFGADRCYYCEIENGQAIIRRDASAEGLPSVAGTYPLADFALLQAVIDTGRLFIVHDVRQDPAVDENLRQLCVQLQVISYLNVPVIKNGQPAGVLCLVQSQPRDWTAAETALATEVAERTWIAVERTRAETARQASEEKYRTLFDTMDEGFAVCGVVRDAAGQVVDLRYQELNRGLERQTGLNRQTILGRKLSDVFLPADVERWLPIYAEVVKRGEPATFEEHAALLDRWFAVSAYPRKRDELAIFYRDITEHKRHEEQQAFLLHFSDALRAEPDVDAVAKRALALLIEQLGLDRSYITTYRLAENRADIDYQIGNDSVPPLPDYLVLSDYPAAFKTTLRNTVVIKDDWERQGLSEAEKRNSIKLGMRAMVAATLRKEHTPLWSMVASNSRPRHWTPGEIALVEEVAERTLAAMERARTEEALRISESKYRTLFESMDEGFCLIEMLLDEQGTAVDYRFLEVNPAFERQTGLADVLGRLGSELTPGTEPYWLDTYGQVVRTGVPVHLENYHAGTGRWYEASASRVDGGGSQQVAIVFNNTTARKRAEDALRDSEARLKALVTNLPGAAVFVVDRDLRYQVAEGEALAKAGFRPADLLGRTVAETMPPNLVPHYEAHYRRALAGQAFSAEHMAHGFTYLSRGVPLPGPEGLPEAVLVVSYDITQRKQAEEALQASELKYRTLFETMDQGFGIGEVLPADEAAGKPLDWQWLEVNPAFERLTGLPRATVLTQTTRQLIPGLEEIWYERYGYVAATGETVSFESYSPVLNRWFDVYVFALGSPAARRVAVLFSNTTEHKQVEAALRVAEARYREQLEQQVAERTRELQASRDLLQAVFDTSLIAMSVQEAVRDETGAIQDFRLRLVSRELEHETGRTDLVGKLYAQEYPGIREVGLFDLAVRALETGMPQSMEYYYAHDGFAKWFACQFVKLGDNGLVATNLDITERKTAEQERTRNLHLLEQAEAVAGLGSWDYDLRSQVFRWSDGMYHLFDLPLGQPIEAGIYSRYVVEEDRLRAQQLAKWLTTGSGSFEATLRLRLAGQVKTLRLKAVVLSDEAGQPLRVLGVDLDISELQRLEADNLRLRLTQQQALFEAVQAAQETERRRMAESLHNGIGQILYATKLRLDRLHAPLLGTAPDLVAARREADHLLAEAIRQTRALSHELVPMVLEEFGLAAALHDICHKLSTPQRRLRCHLLLDEEAAPLAQTLQMALYRMAQELAQNIIKHARGATQATLELETMPGWVLLRAEDDGIGFASSAAESAGLGLRSIRDRVALLGGQVNIGSASTGGAYVRIRLPIPPSSPHDTPVSR